MEIYNGSRGLKIFTGSCRCGKTTRALERLREYPDAYLIVYSRLALGDVSYQKNTSEDLSKRILTINEFLDDRFEMRMRREKINKIIIDEPFLCSCTQIAHLFYKLGVINAEVIAFGTEKGKG